jgi:hypothetical protein
MIIKTIAAVAGVLALSAAPACAGVYADELGKCLVSSSSPADQIVLVQWMFSAISVNPNVASMTSISPAQRKSYDQQMAHLTQRLLTVDCRKQTIEALKYEGDNALESAFGVLGGVAVRTLTSDPKTAQAMGAFGDDMDKDAFTQLQKDAGIPVDPAAKK